MLISDLYMKVSSMLVISVTIKLHTSIIWQLIFNLNMKVSSMFVTSVTNNLQHRVICQNMLNRRICKFYIDLAGNFLYQIFMNGCSLKARKIQAGGGHNLHPPLSNRVNDSDDLLLLQDTNLETPDCFGPDLETNWISTVRGPYYIIAPGPWVLGPWLAKKLRRYSQESLA